MDKKGQGVGPCLVLSGPDLLRGQMFAISSTRHGFHLVSPACFLGPQRVSAYQLLAHS